MRIVCHDVFIRDAVGNFCLETFRLLKQNGFNAEIYAVNFDLHLNDYVKQISSLANDVSENDYLLYFASTYFENIDDVLSLPFKKKLAYYHGITPPNLIQVFFPEMANKLSIALEQGAALAHFDKIAANSSASAAELLSTFDKDTDWKLEDIVPIAPKLLPTESIDKNFQKQMHVEEPQATRFLFVGRIYSNKKIEDLLRFFSEYLKLEPTAELHLIGFQSGDAYQNYLTWVQDSELEIPKEQIVWKQNLTEEELAECYHTASAFINMSEHEGFCLPIFEAMQHHLPVFSYFLDAIFEIYDDSVVFFYEKNFEILAGQIYEYLSDENKIAQLVARQKITVSQLSVKMNGDAMLGLCRPDLGATKITLT